ncbi:MAG: transporter [Chthoniobacterales bacterium]
MKFACAPKRFWVAAMMLAAAPVMVHATEGGGTSKALGVDTVLAGMMPPPGLNITNFTAFYFADRTLDSDGNDRPNLSNFDLFVFAEVLRFRYVFPKVTFLGANIEARVGWTLVNQADVSFDVRTPFGTFQREDSTTNMGDSLLGLILGWHGKKFHQMFGPELFLPTGKFSDDRLTNTSRGYYAIGPSYWFTWFPIEQIEVSGALIYLINFENPDTNYRSGQELSFDYNLGYWILRDWELGVSGYAYKQVADDEVNGQTVGDGNKGQAVAFGPALRWHPHDKNYGVTLKWQHEELVENRTKGERFFLQAAIQF